VIAAVPRRIAFALGLALAVSGCSNDTAVKELTGSDDSGNPDGESTGDTDPTETDGSTETSGDPTEADTTGESTDTGDESGDTGDGGGEPEPILPRSSMDMASAAVVSYSTNYTMVLVMGQSTTNLSSMSSPSYRLDGGTVRVSGSPP
jgi:hypothetical protein